MRQIDSQTITETVEKTFMTITHLPGDDLVAALEKARREEESPTGRDVLGQLLENARIGREEQTPICQDTGSSVVFAEIGQDVRILGETPSGAIEKGVSRGYARGYLRASIVDDPLRRRNTTNNTPPFIHTEIVPGDRIKLTMMAKGSGCENMSRFKMLTPAQGRQGVVDFVINTVLTGGGRPCPPLIVGVGIGGTFDMTTQIAKKSLFRPLGQHHPAPHIKELEEELLGEINDLGLGPQGWGGRTTALAVHVETYPCHIASLPVAVNIECHSHRVKTVKI
ncbi:MAG: fumarate hydratase [Candidatus Brocadiales bacterium]